MQITTRDPIVKTAVDLGDDAFDLRTYRETRTRVTYLIVSTILTESGPKHYVGLHEATGYNIKKDGSTGMQRHKPSIHPENRPEPLWTQITSAIEDNLRERGLLPAKG